MKRFLYSTICLVAILVVILIVNFVMSLPPERQYFDDSAFDLEAKVGLYSREDGSELLVTWDATRGLRIHDVLDVDPDRHTWHLVPETTNRFNSIAIDGDQNEVFLFSPAKGGKVETFKHITADGTEQSAQRKSDGAYDQKLVEYYSDTVKLVATVLLPRRAFYGVGIVMIHGSGSSDRSNLWYMAQADFLARNGIAVLLPDKRGSGKSGSEWQSATLHDFVGDALAAKSALQKTMGDGQHRIGVLGISQGGHIVPMVAVKDPDLAFAVSVVGSTTTLNETLIHELSSDLRGHVPEILVRPLAEANGVLVRARRPRFWLSNGDISPSEYWQDLSVPGLAIFAANDDNVPVEMSLSVIAQLNGRRGQPIDTMVFENVGHSLFDPKTNWYAADYLPSLVEWIEANTQ